MKKYVLTLVSVLCFVLAIAQPPQTAVAIQSKGHERFWVYINKQLQNERADEVVIAKDLAPRTYSVTIVMDNRKQTTFKTKITLHTGVNYFEVAYLPQNNRISFREADKDAQMAGDAINAFGRMVYQMDAQYNVNTQQQRYQDNIHGQNGHIPAQAPNHTRVQEPAHNYNYNTTPSQERMPSQKPMVPAPNSTPASVPAPEPAPAPKPCNDKDFMEIKQLVQKETYEDAKLTIAKQATAAELLTVDQLAEIATLFTFEDTKLQYLKFAYDFCFDPNKYYKLNKVFTYSSSIDELNEFLQTKRK